ncbi:MAG: NADPH:quinone reductase [Pseudomonadota bacterium]
MRAARYERTGQAHEVLEVVDLPSPQPAAGEVLVEIHASGVNPHDVKKRSGWLGGSPALGGVVPHSDGAGVVNDVGPGVDPSRIGERVFVFRAGPARGTCAECVVVPASHAVGLPAGVGFDAGACIGVPSITAWLAVLADGPVTGDTVLINGGSGAVGRMAVELAVWNGARVIATAGGPDRMAIATRRGADIVLDYRSDDLASAILDLTHGEGVQRIVDVDFGANVALNAKVLADHGTIAAYSSTSNRTPTLPYYDFALKPARLTFVQGAKLQPGEREAAVKVITALMGKGRLLPDISDKLPLEEVADAHVAVEGGADGNVVVMLRDGN